MQPIKIKNVSTKAEKRFVIEFLKFTKLVYLWTLSIILQNFLLLTVKIYFKNKITKIIVVISVRNKKFSILIVL
jgi:hypothetical protein